VREEVGALSPASLSHGRLPRGELGVEGWAQVD
jgi:hypothetical protein